MKVKVVAYKNRLVVVPEAPEKDIDKDWWPTGGGRSGCLLGDSEALLGISAEAFQLMKEIPRNDDERGDIGWWKCTDGKYVFSWGGPIHRVIDPDKSEGDKDFRVRKGKFTLIPNEVPAEAVFAIDKNPDALSWKEPNQVVYP